VRYVSVPIKNLKHHSDRGEFDRERLFEFGIPVVAGVATAISNNKVSAECRWENVLNRETDTVRLLVSEAE
jgi:hypothetical protein